MPIKQKRQVFYCEKPKHSVSMNKIKAEKVSVEYKVWSDSRCNFTRPTGRQHLDIYVTLESFRSTAVGDGKLTSVTVLGGCRPRPLARGIVSLPNISLERTRKTRRSTLTLDGS